MMKSDFPNIFFNLPGPKTDVQSLPTLPLRDPATWP